MTKAEIAMQLTIAMLDKKLPYNANSNAEMGAAIAEIYNAIYKSICPTRSTNSSAHAAHARGCGFC